MNRPVVLVVEDNEIQRKVIRLLASEYDFDVIMAGDCSQACNAVLADANAFDLILMDIRLPDADGVECTRLLREMYAPKHVPVVAMTGFVKANDSERCKQLGFDDCLIKPFSAHEFKSVVIRWTETTRNVVAFPRAEDISGQSS